MGTTKEPKPAKYFVALLLSDANLLNSVEQDLCEWFGTVDGRSKLIPWEASQFYAQEMGPSLWRGFLSFTTLRSPVDLAALKLRSQEIEERFCDDNSHGRRANLDPGYLDAFKVVLASTKNASQRIYLNGGIYAEVTLQYHDGGFHGLASTYPDYLWPVTLGFLTQMRAVYLEQLRQV